MSIVMHFITLSHPAEPFTFLPGQSVAVYDMIICLFINQFFFADKRN